MKKFDVLGKRINFYYDDQETVTSGFGGFISTLIIIFLSLLIASFGQDFFKRTNPYMFSSIKSPEDYTKFVINNKNFSFAFQLGEFILNHNHTEDTTLFYPVVEYYYYQKNEKLEFEYTVKRLKVESCTQDHFYDNAIFANTTNLDSLYCPIFDNLTVGGYMDGDFMAKIQIEIIQCMEGNTDLTGNPCKPDRLKEEMLAKKLYFVLYYQNTLIDANDYDNGLKLEIVSSYYTLDKLLYKNPYFFFQNNTLETDYGWIMENKRKDSFLGFKTKYMDMNSYETLDEGGFSGSLSRAVLYFSKDTLIYEREYLKIEKLAAQVGGIIEVFMIIGVVFIDRYNLFKAKIELGSLLMFDKKHNKDYLINSEISIFSNKNRDNINKKVSSNSVKFQNSDIISACNKSECPIITENNKTSNNITSNINIISNNISNSRNNNNNNSCSSILKCNILRTDNDINTNAKTGNLCIRSESRNNSNLNSIAIIDENKNETKNNNSKSFFNNINIDKQCNKTNTNNANNTNNENIENKSNRNDYSKTSQENKEINYQEHKEVSYHIKNIIYKYY